MHKEKGPSRQKEESHSLSAATSGVPTLRSFMLTSEGRLRPYLDAALVNPSTGSSRLFHYAPMTKIPDLDELPKVTNTSLKLYIPNTLLKL